jgi:hypothetical protein
MLTTTVDSENIAKVQLLCAVRSVEATACTMGE